MRINTGARGKAVRSVVIAGRPEMTKPLRKTPSIGQNIERWMVVNAVEIPGTKIELQSALLDTLIIA
jgi:hypothetical protein